ncbi:MAG TPA: hypothetical protein VH372_26865 [Actinospica sp.]|nr:hypothetical protein [Actinospica sp.]
MTTREVTRHHRHLLELASLLATAGIADAFADVFGARRDGSGLLIGLGVALIVGTVGHHVWLRRTDHAPPAAEEVMSVVDRAATGEFWRIRTRIDNTPGRLAVLAGALAAAGANIQALEAHPAPGGVIDEFLVETSQATTAEQLCAAVRAVGGREVRAVPADVLALLDVPTRALELAGRLVREPESFDAVLAELLDARSVEVGAADSGAPAEWIDGATLVLRRADGTTFTVSRPELPFTATELSRVRALVQLVCPHPASEAPTRLR